MTLEERIKKMLEESTKQVQTAVEVVAEEESTDQVDQIEENKMANLKAIAAKDKQENKDREDDYLDDDGKTAKKAKLSKEVAAARKLVKSNESSGVSDQVASLLEAEGLSEEFKVQAVTIFEAAVTDRVLQIQEQMEAEYAEKLDEAKAELESNIDGFLNECVQEWASDNEVAIASNFRSQLAESFMDGIQSLLAEHNIDLPEESENALSVALESVNTLQENLEQKDVTVSELESQIAELKAEKILESFRDKMSCTEFDRFTQLTESVKFKDETQYEKQLNVVLENFGKLSKTEQAPKAAPAPVFEEVVSTKPIVTETYSAVDRYAAYMQKSRYNK